MFIEVHDRVTKNPALINIDHITLIVPDQDKKHSTFVFNGSDRRSRITESYEEVCAMIGNSGEPAIKRSKLVGDMIIEGRITSNEARILLGLDEVD